MQLLDKPARGGFRSGKLALNTCYIGFKTRSALLCRLKSRRCRIYLGLLLFQLDIRGGDFVVIPLNLGKQVVIFFPAPLSDSDPHSCRPWR